MHHIRYSLRHSTSHGTQPAAEGQHSTPHGTQPAVDRRHPPTTRDTPYDVWTIPELHGEQHSVDSHWVRNDLAAALWCRIEPPPSLRRSSTLHASSSSKPPNKKTGRDPNGSRPVSRCGLCRWQGGVAPTATAPTRCHCVSGTGTPVPAATVPTRRHCVSGTGTPAPAAERTQSSYCSSL